MPSKKPLFERGYEAFTERAKKSKWMKSCYSCEYYYKTDSDDEEVCQNTEVLQYDMVITERDIYCSYWKIAEVESGYKKEEYKTRERDSEADSGKDYSWERMRMERKR